MRRPDRRSVWKPIALIAVVVLLFALALTFDLGDRLAGLEAWIEGLGPWGPLAFIVLYVVATVAMVPGTGPSVIAGGLFGAIWGTVYVSIGSTIGAALCFLIARHFARDAAARWLRGRATFEKLDRLVETRGAWIVAITRLVPVFPYNLLNYGFGLTGVPFGTYVVVSWIFMIPGTLLYVAGGDALAQALREGRVSGTTIVLVGAVLASLVAIGYFARKRLRSTRTSTREDSDGRVGVNSPPGGS